MFLLMCLFLSVSSSSAMGESLERQSCQGPFCITLRVGVITAEAGMCVVIPCSFTTSYDFIPHSIVWFKCSSDSFKCLDSERIFSRNSRRVQPDFVGRVSLLEPDVRQRNCSIIIRDVTASDSGSYQLRVNGHKYYSGREDGFQYSQRATVSVKDLTQKPTLMIPPLTEGQQATLSCAAPGLCSGSAPDITWILTVPGENDYHITENVTKLNVNQRQISTLTFMPSARHHGNSIMCKVSFRGGTTTVETAMLNVTYMKELKISGKANMTEGESLNLTCIVESFPPSQITWTRSSDKRLQKGKEMKVLNVTDSDQKNKTETYLQKGSGEATLSISNVTAEDSGEYICTAKHLNTTLMEKVDVQVIYFRTPVITGNATVGKGDTLNLTCSVESFPLSYVSWTLVGSNSALKNDTGSSTLIIPNMNIDHSGRYTCTVKHLEQTVAVFADVTVIWLPSIFKTSACEIQSEVLTCVCVSEGFPLPTIKWPLLKRESKYSVITTVTDQTINSTVTVTVKNHSSLSPECLSSNQNGEAKESLIITTNMPGKDGKHSKWRILSQLEVIIAFFIGFLLSAILCLLARECHRKRQMRSGNLNDTVEMVTSQEDPLIDGDHIMEDDQTYDQEVAEGGEAVAADKAAPGLDGGPKDVEYATINYSLLKRKIAREAAKRQETEYAEIKQRVKEQREDNSGQDGDVLEDNEVVMMGEKEETEQCVPEDEDMAVYSNVKEMMDEV